MLLGAVNTPISSRTRKRRLLRQFARDAARFSHIHSGAARRWKQVDDGTDVVLILLAALTVSSIFLNYINTSEMVQLLSAIFGSAATVGQAIKKGIGVTRRWMTKQQLANNYADLSREVVIRLTQTNMSEENLTVLLNDVDERLAIMAPGEPIAEPADYTAGGTRGGARRATLTPPSGPPAPPNTHKTHSSTPSPIDLLIENDNF